MTKSNEGRVPNIIPDKTFSQDYDTLRQFFRYTCLSRCCTSADYAKWCGLNKKNVDKLKPRYQRAASGLETSQKDGKKRRLTLNNKFEDGGIVLANSYRLCSVQSSQLLMDFAIIGQLSMNQEKKMQEVYKKIDASPFSAYMSFHNQKKMICDLEEYGCIVPGKNGHCLANDVLHGLQIGELQDLFDEISHWIKVSDFAVPGYFFLDQIALRLRCKDTEIDSIFTYRQDDYYAMAEEDLILELLPAVAARSLVKISYAKVKQRKKWKNDDTYMKWYDRELREPSEKIGYCIKLEKYNASGRTYLIFYNKKTKNVEKLRVDGIESWESIKEQAGHGKNRAAESHILRLELEHGEQEERLLRDVQQCFRQELIGTAEKVNDHYQIMLQVHDFTEILPRLFSFGNHVRIVCTDAMGQDNEFAEKCAAKMRQKIQDVLCLYGEGKENEIVLSAK